MSNQQLEVRKDNLAKTRLVPSTDHVLVEGQVRVEVEHFALTANNITYGVVGEKIGYWQFFPCEDGWGIIPVWGFAKVSESKHPQVKVGERLYGYWPMGQSLIIAPTKVSDSRLFDGAEHRAQLPPVYNAYARVSGEPHHDSAMDEERSLLFPLYATSFCLYDFLKDNDYFSATQVIIPSASSKTAIGLAYALESDADAKYLVGLTSQGNVEKVKSLGIYDEVFEYGEIPSITNDPSVIVDMSGNGTVLAELHLHLGDNMRYTSNVGVTHYNDNNMGEGFIRERSEMFFAPGHIQKRTKELQPGEFEKMAYAFWHEATIKSRAWLKLDHVVGMEQLSDIYQAVLAGKTDPNIGLIIRP